jgi:cytoskeleton-associated protein 5
LSPKDKTQLEERLRRVAGPSTPDRVMTPVSARASTGLPYPGSPSARVAGLPQPTSPTYTDSRLIQPASPSQPMRTASPAPSNIGRPFSPVRNARIPGPSSHLPGPSLLPGPSNIPGGNSPSAIGRPKLAIPSRLGPPRTRVNNNFPPQVETPTDSPSVNGHDSPSTSAPPVYPNLDPVSQLEDNHDGITITISSILSNDPARSVDALKKIQKVLDIGSDAGPSSPDYRDMAEHTEGLIETISLQMAHVFERPENVAQKENFRLAKHLIQTLNAFCDHTFLAESLTVDILTSLLEELTMRLLQTDNSQDTQLKDLSRFINMIILRLFATARRMSVFR